MPTSYQRATRNRRPRAVLGTTTLPRKTAGIKVSSAGVALSVLTITFDQTVILNGVPQYEVDVAGVTPVSAALTSPTTVAITYSASVATATSVTIPYEEPAVRNSSGGFVSTSAVNIA